MSHRFRPLLVSTLLAGIVLLGLSQSAHASVVAFSGPQQTLGMTITSTGSYDVIGPGTSPFAIISGANYTLIPGEQTGALGLVPSTVNVNTNPLAVGINTASPNGPYKDGSTPPVVIPNATDFEAKNGHLEGAFNVGLDLLNGANPSFAITPINLSADKLLIPPPPLLPHDFGIQTFSITLTGISFANLFFTQTGTATFTDGANGTGTYDIPGALGGKINITIGIQGNPLAESFNLNSALDLTGTYHLDNGPPKNLGMSLDGGQNLSLPLTLDEALATAIGPIGLTGTILVASSINFAVNYHLQGVMVPEPGSVILLGVGLLAVVPLVHRSLRKNK
jgi:hypothetical protein